MAATLVPLPEVERLSARVIRILGGNPGKFTLQGTNTYLVGQGPSRLLIDTGQGEPSWIAALREVLAAERATISHVLLTHWHHDHVGGVPDLLALFPPSNSSTTTTPPPTIHKRAPPSTEPSWKDITDGQRFAVPGAGATATLRALVGPGHTADHTAFVLEEEDALFTGDAVLGQGTAVFEDLAAYVASLGRMSAAFAGRAYPGHGPVVEDGPAKVLEYIRHRKQREEQVLEALAGPASVPEGWRSMELVKLIYKDYPESLHAPAERGVRQVLEKLAEEGMVAYNESTGAWTLRAKNVL